MHGALYSFSSRQRHTALITTEITGTGQAPSYLVSHNHPYQLSAIFHLDSARSPFRNLRSELSIPSDVHQTYVHSKTPTYSTLTTSSHFTFCQLNSVLRTHYIRLEPSGLVAYHLFFIAESKPPSLRTVPHARNLAFSFLSRVQWSLIQPHQATQPNSRITLYTILCWKISSSFTALSYF